MAKRKEVKKKPSLPPIICKGCGIKFVPRSHKQHYHSESCREEFYTRTYYTRQVENKQCPNCGNTFVTSRPGRQVYCCAECRNEARTKRRGGVIIDVQAQRKQFYTERYRQLVADGFACRLCGKMARDGVKLDVEDDGRGGKMTICNICSIGRRAG